MTEKETIGVLAILKAAYPNQLNKLNENEANGIVQVWLSQFYNIPGDIVILAVQRLIGTSQFFPTIAEVKDKIKSLHFDAMWAIRDHEQAIDPEIGFGNKLSNKALAKVEYVYNNTFDDRSLKREPTFNELIGLSMNSQTEELELTTTPLMQIENKEQEE